MRYVPPGQPGSPVSVLPRYDNFLGGKWIAPTEGRYRSVVAPATAREICEVADSTAADLELALDAAHGVRDAWGERSAVSRAKVLTAVADAIEDNAEALAVAESWETGRPIREALGVDVSLAAGHFRSFAAAAGAEEGVVSGFDDILAYQFREPLGVVAHFLPVHFPVLMAAWNLAPALAAGNCPVLKPASGASWSVLKLAEVIGEVLPPGVVNVVTGRGEGVGRDLASSRRIAKVVPAGPAVTVGSPGIVFADVLACEDDFLDRTVDELVAAAADEGLPCTSPPWVLVQEPACEELIGRALERIADLVVDDPLDTATRVGPRGGADELAKVESAVDRGRREGAEVLIGGHRVDVGDEFSEGYFYAPTVLRGQRRMRSLREDLCGPVLAVTTFTGEEDAIANVTRTGPGACVWTRDGDRARRFPAGARHSLALATDAGGASHRIVLDQYSRMTSLVDRRPLAG